MKNNIELKKRILKGIAYFAEKKPGEYNVADITHERLLLNLVKAYLKGEEIIIKDLRVQEETAGKAEEVFNAPVSTEPLRASQSNSIDHPGEY